MKHIKIKSSEVLHGGKTLDKVLGENKQEDIPVIEFKGNLLNFLTTLVKAIYNENTVIKINSIYGTSITPSRTGGSAIFYISTFVTEASNEGAATPILVLGCSTVVAGQTKPVGLMEGPSAVDKSVIQVYNGTWYKIGNITYEDVFNAAGLTVEDFLRKFVPDSPYLT